jgi:hypothetical protein
MATMTSSKNLFWAAFVLFVACALYFDRHENLFTHHGPLAPVKLLVWAAFLGFLAYTAYCSSRENLFRSIGKMAEVHWGRQVGADLYLGLLLMIFVVYLNEGSALVVLLWLVPVLAFANLATLLYFALHFDQIVARFLT